MNTTPAAAPTGLTAPAATDRRRLASPRDAAGPVPSKRRNGPSPEALREAIEVVQTIIEERD